MRLDPHIELRADGCEPCRAHYDRQLWLAELDPGARSAEDRLGRGLGLRPEAEAGARFGLAAALATAVAIAAGALWLRPAPGPQSDEFAARGGQLPARGTSDPARLETAALAGFLATIEMGLGVNVLLVARL